MSVLSVEECELLGDGKYRTYINQVEKVLKSFEYTSEWADLISALGKLNKVLQNHIKYPVIPKRVVIGKRLAQCLHPALPSGVHLKALETYDIIFKCIGPKRLAQDMFVYTAGLFPLMGYSAMNVKPTLLSLYEKHFTHLGPQIKPGLGGLLLGLLPGMEENSEYYDRTNTLLEIFCDASGAQVFYTCMWECILKCPTVRLPAVTYLLTHYDKKKSMDDQLHMMGLNIDLLVLAICSTVQDSSVLVQRSILDFMLLAFPLHLGLLTKNDVTKIIQSAVTVLLRRDMSLNRRLYAWLLGINPNSAPVAEFQERTDGSDGVRVSYFQNHARESLVSALKFYLNDKQTMQSSTLKPFKMVITLLDKPEIGSVIIEELFLDLLRCLFHECSDSSSSDAGNARMSFKASISRQDSVLSDKGTSRGKRDDVIKTANILFNSLEPYFMWDYVARTFEKVCQEKGTKCNHGDSSALIETCNLVQFLLDNCSLETYMETTTEHLPDLLRHLLLSLTNHIEMVSDDEVTSALHLCAKILQKVQPSMTTLGRIDDDSFTAKDIDAITNSLAKNVPLHEELEDTDNTKDSRDQDDGDVTDDDSDQTGEETKSESKDTEIKETRVNSGRSDCTSPSQTTKGDGENVESEDEFKKYNAIEISDTSPRMSYKISGPMTLIQACVNSFQYFFHVYVTKRILIETNVARKGIDVLTQNSSFSATERDSVIDDDGDYCCVDYAPSSSMSSPQSFAIGGNHVMKSSCDVFTRLCRLLVEFSSFPMYCTDYDKLMQQTQLTNDDNSQLPDWLQELLTCCCFLRNFSINAIAITTIFDLIILSKSMQKESKFKATEYRRRSMIEGTVSVVILPVLLPTHLDYINKSTHFYETVTEVLWGYLEESSSENHQQTVDLFHQLHQLTPSLWICEDIIGRDLVSDSAAKKVEAYRKFARLWHLTRDKQTEVIPGVPLRTFDRSMFMLLDSLKEDSSSCHALAQTWLTHALQRGDLGRILEPILLMLLHPDTARISVQHVSIHQPQKVQLEEEDHISSEEAKIYAISNDGGNVLYHVSSPSKSSFSRKKSESLKSYTLAVMSEKGQNSVITTPSRTQLDMPFDRVNADDLKLCVNPLTAEYDLDRLMSNGLDGTKGSNRTNIANAKRLSRETCEREGIVFGGDTSSTPLLAGVSGDGDLKQTMANGGDYYVESKKDRKVDRRKKNVEEKSFMDDVEFVSRDVCDESMGREQCINKPLVSPGEIVASILDELVSDVVKGENLSNGSETDSTAMMSKPTWLKLDQDGGSAGSKGGSCGDLLNDIDRQAFGVDTPSESDGDFSSRYCPNEAEAGAGSDDATGIHALHMHLLLYTQKYDYERVLYALSTFKTILNSCPKLVVFAMASSGVSDSNINQNSKLTSLLARHKKSVFGKNFFGEIKSDSLTSYRSSMYLEIFIMVALYFIRSYYPNFTMTKLSPDELLGNKNVHTLSTEILSLLISHTVTLTKERNRSFSSYINDVLSRCKLQKSLLHCMLASVYNFRKSTEKPYPPSLTETIVQFNEDFLDPSSVDTFQIKILRLLFAVITLENEITSHENELPHVQEFERIKNNLQSSLHQVRYSSNVPMVEQPMFLAGILSALRQHHVSHLHQQWIAMVTSSLPYMGKSMPQMVLMVMTQLCRNLELNSNCYASTVDIADTDIESITPDHMLILLEGLTTLCLYCLLDTYSNVSIMQTPHVSTVSSDTPHTQIMSNLLNIFNPVSSREQSPVKEPQSSSPIMEARRSLLKNLPRIISCLCVVWKDVTKWESDADGDRNCWIMGKPKRICQLILEFLSPISVPHGPHLLAAFAVTWNDSRPPNTSLTKQVNPALSDDQQLLVDLLLEIRVLPMDTLVQTVKQVLKHPPHTDLSRNKKLSLEVNLLQLFYSYMTSCSSSQLLDSWTALLGLFRDVLTLSLPPLALFLLVEIIHEFVTKTPPMDDRKQQKDLQDICQKILEAVGNVAGSCLEQSTWLRRNYSVRAVRQVDSNDGDNESMDETDSSPANPPQRTVISPQNSTRSDAKYSVQALTLLSQRTMSLLDVVYGSEEKDKIVPFLNSVLYNVFPYLRNHSRQNLPSLRACSHILATISGYPYTRKAWRKEAMELYLDQAFFQVDCHCVLAWKVVIDNLMTHDKTTFKDLMTRVTVAQSNSLNIFSPKDQEFEQRAHLIKCLAFAVYCSEVDQYQRSMPDIQERLSESLRSPQIPSVMCHVFLCFRVLILRMSPHHLTSLWPTIITEMVQVFMQIEQELSSETEEFKSQLQRIAALDASWAHLGNGLNAHNNPVWLQLYLSAAKLLDLLLVLPADVIPQFQLYRWAFIGDVNDDTPPVPARKNRDRPVFIPHIRRINRLLQTRSCDVEPLYRTAGRPLLTTTHIRSIQDLDPFFITICQSDTSDLATINCPSQSPLVKSRSVPEFDLVCNTDDVTAGPELSAYEYIESIIERDFLEPLNRM